MPRFMIETTHDPDPKVCVRTLDSAVEQGSHYLGNAWWGCDVDVHKAWIFVDADTKNEALMMVPVGPRHEAEVTAVRQYTPEQIRELHSHLA